MSRPPSTPRGALIRRDKSVLGPEYSEVAGDVLRAFTLPQRYPVQRRRSVREQ
jgi:hypothetical protein